MIDIDLLLFIAIILLSTKLLSVFMKRIHMPQIVGALIAGILLGPAVFNYIQPNEVITVIAEFGVILLLFAAGMETDFKQLKSCAKSSLVVSVFGIAASLGGGFAVSLLFGNPSFESFFIGLIIASMSTSITVEALYEMGKIKTKTGVSILGASLFDDVIVIIMLAFTMGMRESGFSAAALAMLLLQIAAFFLVAVFAGMCINKLFDFMYKRFGKRRRLIVFAIAYCFFMAWLAEIFGLADITGAYIAGIAFCSTRCTEFLETKTHELSYMFFTPVFLANIGIHTSFEAMTGNMVLFTAALVAAAIIFKLLGCGIGAKICRFSNKESFQIGSGMTARGEVSFIVAAKGMAAGYVSALIFPSVIVVVLVTVLITPLLLKAAYSNK
jgi:Kef-type K+ transport system membrane component KefB